jgi:hypothetical protein
MTDASQPESAAAKKRSVQVKYPGQRSLRIELRDGSGGGIQGIPPGDNGSAEQLFIDGCIAERLTPD